MDREEGMLVDDGLIGEELKTIVEELFVTGGFEAGSLIGRGATCLISLLVRLFLRACGDCVKFPSCGLLFGRER